jgi:hypothetical protein
MAGAGYKLFATGDVLTAAQVNTYLMQQTVMVFASSAARTTALSGVLAEGMVSYLQDTNTLEVYNGSAWVGATGDITGLTAGTGISITSETGPVPTVAIDTAVTVDLTTAQTLTTKTLTSPVLTTPSISNIDAKGDILVGTADNTLGVITAGANGETLVADSSTSTGLSWQPTKATQNFCIGGGFDIWQRGTSFTTSSAIYTADRWYQDAGVSTTATQQTTGAPNGARYVYRMELGATGGFNLRQVIETADTVNLQGKTVTFSCLLRRNATYTDDVIIGVAKNSTVNAGVGAAGYTSVGTNVTITNANLPTATGVSDWVLASWTGTIPNDGTANTLRLRIGSGGSSQSSGAYIEVALVQVEVGSTRTNFNRAGGTIQGELAACQRYYFRYTPDAGTLRILSTGQCVSTTVAGIAYKYPVTMRTRPTALEQSGTAANYALLNATGTAVSCSAVPSYDSATTTEFGWFLFTVASGLVAGNATVALSASTSGHLGWSAEL